VFFCKNRGHESIDPSLTVSMELGMYISGIYKILLKKSTSTHYDPQYAKVMKKLIGTISEYFESVPFALNPLNVAK
jgi:hypothetical protein